MNSRLILVIGLLFLGFSAHAQNCVKSMSLAPYPSGVNKFHSASGRCINDSSVNSSFSSLALPDANGAHASLNQKCQAIAGGCAPKPPPVYYNYSYSIRAQFISSVASSNLVSVKFSSSALDPVQCRKVTTTHSAVLDKNIPDNAYFFSRFPTASNQWLNVYLACTSPVVTQSTSDAYGIASYSKTYSGCKVLTSSLTSAPISYIQCY
ncbi:MAG: hypothetical protein K0R29_2385 [Pseudobdellovibrio sp.]|jgi:hypothetical protein|nr:hypothetical protein [Pseudobdellovibrio sp.]